MFRIFHKGFFGEGDLTESEEPLPLWKSREMVR